MNTVKVDINNVCMVAHRGLSGLEPENSIPAFVAAGNRSYYGIETDVHMTKDGKFVVIHDELTGRVASDCPEINVETSYYDAVRKVVLDNICEMERRTGQKIGGIRGRDDLLIPRLEDYINICKKYEKVAVLEVKNEMAPEDLARMVEEIKTLDYLDHVIFISFSLTNMVELRDLLPNQKLQYLTIEYNEEIREVLKEYKLGLDIYFQSITKEIIDTLHEDGTEINVWTVDDPAVAGKLAEWGVDYITSNNLE